MKYLNLLSHCMFHIIIYIDLRISLIHILKSTKPSLFSLRSLVILITFVLQIKNSAGYLTKLDEIFIEKGLKTFYTNPFL
jgi:hypothetical protein